MEYQALEAAARSFFRDAPQEFLEPGEVLFWFNEAQADLAIRERLLEGSAVVAASGGGITLPADFVTPKELYPTLSGEGNEIGFVDDDHFIIYGSQPRARVFNNKIELNPAPLDGTSYTLRYVRLPVPLDGSPNAVPEVPVEYQYRMIKFVQAQGLYKEREDALADRKMAEYEAGLLPRPVGNMNKTYGPLNLTVAGGSFQDFVGY